MSGYIQTNQIINIPNAAAYTVGSADSGKLYTIGTQTLPCIITLPILQAGLHYRFMINLVTVSTVNITSPNANTAYGVLINTTINSINIIIKQGATSTAQFLKSSYSGIAAVVNGFGP